MDKRAVTKFAAKTVVSYATRTVVVDIVGRVAPSTKKFYLPEMLGSIGGFAVASQLEDHIDVIVDKHYSKKESTQTSTD